MQMRVQKHKYLDDKYFIKDVYQYTNVYRIHVQVNKNQKYFDSILRHYLKIVKVFKKKHYKDIENKPIYNFTFILNKENHEIVNAIYHTEYEPPQIH